MRWYDSDEAQAILQAWGGGKKQGGRTETDVAREFGKSRHEVRGLVKWHTENEKRIHAPFIGDYEKVLFLFDVHIPDEDRAALRIAKEFAEDWRPDRVIAGGDWQNCDYASNFPEESTATMEEEYRREEQLLEEFHVTDWFEGNHEERIRRIGGRVDPRFRSLLDPVKNLHLVERGIRVYPYHPKTGVLTLGKLSVLHGWWCNQYAARKHAEAYGCCLFGHIHTFQVFTPSQAFESHTGFAVGCLCKLDLPYTQNKPPRSWIQGFAFGYFLRSGHFSLYDVRIIGAEIS